MVGVQEGIGSLEWLLGQLEQKDSIINGISDCFMLLDAATYRILDVNKAFLDNYKLTRADVQSKKML